LRCCGAALAQDAKVARGLARTLGTTYASNLRINVHAMSEGDWIAYIKNLKARPPMPWWSTKATTDEDLRAMYQYIMQLGPAGAPAQPYLPPDMEPKPPFIQYPMPPK
jgi:hypothetical protein